MQQTRKFDKKFTLLPLKNLMDTSQDVKKEFCPTSGYEKDRVLQIIFNLLGYMSKLEIIWQGLNQQRSQTTLPVI